MVKMIRKNIVYCLLLCPILLLSCADISEKTESSEPKIYFDLAGLVANQVKILNDQQPEVLKTAVIDDDQEQKSITVIDWKKELSLFANADLNRPRLRSLYETRAYADQNGHQVTAYEIKEKDVSGVIKMEIVKDASGQNLKQISIENCESNLLYTTEQWLSLNFEGRNEDLALTSYAINGFEKMVMKDTMTYEIRGQIN